MVHHTDPSLPFNPLDRLTLAESIGRELEARPCTALPPDRFLGAGIYAIYYSGDFDLYRPISLADCRAPIYVGEAMPASGTGSLDLASVSRTGKLYQRLAQHAQSIRHVENLQLKHFSCRYLLLDDIWIHLGENYLINLYKPLWNSTLLSGFGIHKPGKGREAQKRSLWDELHPGREVAAGLATASRTAGEISESVRRYFAAPSRLFQPETGEGANSDVLPDSATETPRE
jgi:hypothetical protein